MNCRKEYFLEVLEIKSQTQRTHEDTLPTAKAYFPRLKSAELKVSKTVNNSLRQLSTKVQKNINKMKTTSRKIGIIETLKNKKFHPA